MNNFYSLTAVTAAVALLGLLGCAGTNPPGNSSVTSAPYSYPQSSVGSARFGVVQSIDLVRPDAGGSAPGVGTLAGALVGGILGSQVGGGHGTTAATVLGVAGGAYAGHELERRNQDQNVGNAVKLTIRFNDGSYQSVTQTTHADIRVGDPVMVDQGVARRY